MPNFSTLSLTQQQRAVVNHNDGPALVFAVAGAGKTTAMVHRIERLVSKQRVRPNQILATSFGKANVADLKSALARWPHCAQVDCRTLHSLGHLLIKKAQRLGHLRSLKLNDSDQYSIDQQLLNETMRLARKQDGTYLNELNSMDRQDFLDYVGACKGNLAYANLAAVHLPEPFNKPAQQAVAPTPELSWYLDLYQLFETVRQEAGVVTFDDMLLTGWEVLVQYADVRAAVQNHYAHILVDEFQDINRAQSEILDLLTAANPNYMAIGDDDQCIYEWRGADPSYILDFPRRYSATVYKIENNFRCPAAPLALANRVIAHNRRREPKQMSLTKGFVGKTAVSLSKDTLDMSGQIVGQIQQLLREDAQSANEIAVLVRLNAQTPPIEQALIAAQIPYRIGTPFYERQEIKTLIHYGRLAWYETQLQGEAPALNEKGVTRLIESWHAVCNRPKRYIAHEVRRHIDAQMRLQTGPVSSLLKTLSHRVTEIWLQDNLMALAEVLRWLSGQLHSPAKAVLAELVDRLDYLEYLRESSGFAETGEERATSVEAFVAFAQKSGSLQEFMTHIRDLANQRAGQADKGQQAVTLSTIHRAKGLEWDHVIIPQVNQATLPFLGRSRPNLEEERRLFYVALTRTRRNLYLHAVQTQPLSIFLQQARYQEVLREIEELTAVLDTPPTGWQAQEVAALLTLSDKYHLTPYFQNWWSADLAAVSAHIRWFWQAYQARVDSRQPNVLEEKLVDPWLQLAPQAVTPPATVNFPGLEPFLVGQARQSVSRPNSVGQLPEPIIPKPPPEPLTIRPGMWLLCDAGWGKILEILDLVQRPLAEVDRNNTYIRLGVILRPDADRLRAEIDVSAKRITFDNERTLYACGKCNAYVTDDSNLIFKNHNREAHGDISPTLKRISGRSFPLTHLIYSLIGP